MDEEEKEEMCVFDCLVGKYVHDFYMSSDKEKILFIVSDEQYRAWDRANLESKMFKTENDCCNSVWFEHISGLSCLIGHKINATEGKGWNNIKDDNCDVLDAAFWTIKTNKGYFDIEVRNSHNGYYGGRIKEVPLENQHLYLLNSSKWKKFQP